MSDLDARDSKEFVGAEFARRFGAGGPGKRCLDCGAGVGRVTKTCLLELFEEVDLVEPLGHFLDQAKDELDLENGKPGPRVKELAKRGHRAVRFVQEPLEEFQPEPGRYDCVWVQWCIGHLTDDDFVEFYARCKRALRPGGLFVLKENTCSKGFVVDKDDSSLTRSHQYFLELFARCGLTVLKTATQKNFPKELFPVRMYLMEDAGGPTADAAVGSKRKP